MSAAAPSEPGGVFELVGQALNDGARDLSQLLGVTVSVTLASPPRPDSELPDGPWLRTQLDFSSGLDGSAVFMFPSVLIEAIVGQTGVDVSSSDLHAEAGLAAVTSPLEHLVGGYVASLSGSVGKTVEAFPPELAWCEAVAGTDVDSSRLLLQFEVSVGAGSPERMLVSLDGRLTAGFTGLDRVLAQAKGTIPSSVEVPATFPVPRGVGSLGALADVQLSVAVELGRAQFTVRDVLGLREGSVIRLRRSVAESVDLIVNGTAAARGDVVVVNGKLGLRISEVIERA